MAPQDINWLARESARKTDFETMMWYSFYILTEGWALEKKKPMIEMVGNIVSAASRYELSDKKIYEFKLTSFVLIMDMVHARYAKDLPAFMVYSLQFRDCLQALMDNGLIDANPIAQLMEDPAYFGKYGW